MSSRIRQRPFAVLLLVGCVVLPSALPQAISGPLPCRPKTLTNSIGMKRVLIPAGTFTMGSPKSEKGREADETPHAVVITRPFYLGSWEVTQAEFHAVVGEHLTESSVGKACLFLWTRVQ